MFAWFNGWRWCAPILGLVWLGACVGPAEDVDPGHPIPLDLQAFDDGKADGYGFNPSHIIDDDLFVDATYLTVEQVQGFLENTPYSRRSFLADYSDNGQTAAEYIIETAARFQINPLVLLVKLQVETSLIYWNSEPRAHLVKHAMGCGCPDGDSTCRLAPKGIFPQINCAARLFRDYFIQMETRGRTLTGWGPGISKATSDGDRIIPENKATAALYTYTPWILRGSGGNWLFWNVTKRFSTRLLRNEINHHWIGGACWGDDDCPFDQGVCSISLSNDGSSQGFCTRPCDSVCPDSRQPHTQITTCVAASEMGFTETTEEGFCTSRCSNIDVNNGVRCPTALRCRDALRTTEDESPRMACVADQGTGANTPNDPTNSDSDPTPHDR